MDKKEYRKLKNKMNICHPELQSGEVWITNIYANDQHIDPNRTSFWDIPWSTKRLGTLAYNSDNTIALGSKPVFVQRSELESYGMDMRKFLPEAATSG